MFPVLRNLLLLSLILLSLLRLESELMNDDFQRLTVRGLDLDLGHLLRGERLEVSRVLGISLSAGWTQPIPLRSEFVPIETTNLKINLMNLLRCIGTDLISTGAGIEVDIVQF